MRQRSPRRWLVKPDFIDFVYFIDFIFGTLFLHTKGGHPRGFYIVIAECVEIAEEIAVVQGNG